MKKNAFLLTGALVIAIISVFAASIFWLKPDLEKQIRSHIDAINSSGAQISIDYDKDALNVSPVTRTVNFKSVVITSTQEPIPVKIVMDNLTLQVAAGMLLLDQDKLPATGDVDIASHISVNNLSVTLSDRTVTVAHHEMDNVTCSASLLRSFSGEQPLLDGYSLLGQLGAGRSSSKDLLVTLEQSTRRLAISHAQIENWRGQNIGKCAFTGIDLATREGVSMQLAQLQMQNVHAPDANTLSRMAQATSIAVKPEMVLPVLADVLANETVPPVQKLLCDNLTLRTPEGDIALRQFNVAWPSIRPQDFTCALTALALPANGILSVMDREGQMIQGRSPVAPLFSGIDTLNANASFTIRAQDTKNTVLHEQLTLELPEWGLLDYAHLGDYANPEIGGRFRDMKLTYTDRSFLARTALIFFPNGKAEEQIFSLLDSFSSPDTASLIETLKAFVARPGRLHVASLPDKNISESEIFLIMANPAAYFDISATAGSKSFAEQCSALKNMP